jgi:DNA-directed RNA polymerase subunit RPC12/RpoP
MLRLISPEEIVNRLHFNPLVEWTEHVIHVGAYRCPKCKKETEFNTGHLRAFEDLKESPLGPAWSKKCEELRPVGSWEWTMDFKCATCGFPVRIIYEHDGEISMGTWKYRLLAIIEPIET